MTKSQLIERIVQSLPAVPRQKVEAIVNAAFEAMASAMARGERIEIRGFGSFAVKTRPSREGRNPKTGEKVTVPPRRSLTFTVGKELRDRLNPEGVSAPPVEHGQEPEPVSRPLTTPVSIASGSSSDTRSPVEPLAASGPTVPGYTLR